MSIGGYSIQCTLAHNRSVRSSASDVVKFSTQAVP